MDINTILPLLLNKNADSNPQMQTILNAVSGKNGSTQNENVSPMSAVISAMSGKNNATQDAENVNPMVAALSAMSGKNGKTPDIATLMSLANMNKKTNKQTPVGFKAIINIAPNDILGALTKMLP